MEHDPRAFLHDIVQACEDIEAFTYGMDYGSYAASSLVRAAVERKFPVIGEALVRMRREFPDMVQLFSDHEKIIGFRNILAHGYDMIDDATVWEAVTNHVPITRDETRGMLEGRPR